MKKMSFIKANGLLGILLGGILASSAALGQDPIVISLSDEAGPADGAIAVSFDFMGNGESSGFDADIVFDDTNVVAVDLSNCLEGNDAFISNCDHPGGDTSIIRMTLAAAGADALGDFTGTIIFELDGTLADGDVIALEWDPDSLGANNPDADVTSTNGSITIGGVGECSLSIAPASHDFGTVTVGDTASQAFTISNDGDGDCTNVTAAVSGADFTLASDDCGTLAASATCTANVDYSPAAAGASTGTLDASADEGSTATADLSGTGDDGTGTGDDGVAPTAIPTMQPLGLALLALVMLMIGAIGVRTFRS